MREDWNEIKMVDACEILTCGVASTPKYVDESIGVPFLSAQNVKNGKVILHKYNYISQEFHEHLTKKNKPRKGDILYSRVGAKYGEAGVIEHDFEFSVYVSVTLMRPKADLFDNYYFKYYLNSPRIKELAKKSIQSSGVPNLNVKVVREFPIPIPPLSEQQQIVAKLDQAFKAIDQAKANIEKNIKNAKELLQSKLNDIFSLKGVGWKKEKMVDVCSILTCGVASTPKYVDESVGVPFLSAQNVKNGEIVLDKYRYISQEFHERLTKKNKPQKGDILYSRVGAKFGEAGVVEHDFEFSVYVSVTLIRPLSEKLNNYYFKYYLNSPTIKSLAKSSITSSGVPNLNVKTVREFPVIYPSINRQLEIVSEIKDLESACFKVINKYELKSRNLTEFKKSILQKAFAGELTN